MARNWSALKDFARMYPETFQDISESIWEQSNYGLTLLHACARYNPPVSVLRNVIELYPEALRKQDCLGRTPLHIAAGYGASSSVMKILTVKYPEACNIQDADGRTPLHFACDKFCKLFNEDDMISSRGPPRLKTVQLLLLGSLESVILEDDDEMNALEYALLCEAPMEVITLLQRAMQWVNKVRRSIHSQDPAHQRANLNGILYQDIRNVNNFVLYLD